RDLGHASRARRRPREPDRLALPAIDAELLARDHADPRVRRRARRPPARLRHGDVAAPRAAGRRPRRGPARAERAPHPRRNARGAGPGLRADGAREGPGRARRGLSSRAPQRGAARHHRRRPVARVHAERRADHRDGLRVAGHGAAHRAGGARPRLPGDPGRRVRLRAGVRRDQPDRRRALHRGRSARAADVRRIDSLALAGALVVLAAVVVAVAAPALAPGDPIKNSLLDRLTPPTWGGEHPLGTDTLGRDVASRLLHGARVSLLVGFSAVLLAGVSGVVLGLVSGWYRGWLDDVLMRLGDVQLAFPVLVLAVAVLAVLGASVVNLILVLGVTGWITYARIVRGEVLTLRERDFVAAARALGADDAWILRRHLLPNVWPAVTVVATFSVARTIIAEASLSFLGLGIPAPEPSWGAMLGEGRNYIPTGWWLALFPGLAILVLVLGINLVGGSLRDLLGPVLARGL